MGRLRRREPSATSAHAGAVVSDLLPPKSATMQEENLTELVLVSAPEPPQPVSSHTRLRPWKKRQRRRQERLQSIRAAALELLPRRKPTWDRDNADDMESSMYFDAQDLDDSKTLAPGSTHWNAENIETIGTFKLPSTTEELDREVQLAWAAKHGTFVQPSKYFICYPRLGYRSTRFESLEYLRTQIPNPVLSQYRVLWKVLQDSKVDNFSLSVWQFAAGPSFPHWKACMPPKVLARLAVSVRSSWAAVGAWWTMLSRGLCIKDEETLQTLTQGLVNTSVRETAMILETLAWVQHPKEVTRNMVEYALRALEIYPDLVSGLLCSWWPRSFLALREVAEDLNCQIICAKLATASDTKSAIRYVCVAGQFAEVNPNAMFPELLDYLKLFCTHVYLEFAQNIPAHYSVAVECALRTVAKKVESDVGLVRLLKNFLSWNEALCVELLITQLRVDNAGQTFDDSAAQVLISRLRLTTLAEVQDCILDAMIDKPQVFAKAGGMGIVLSMMRRRSAIKGSRLAACEAAARMAPYDASTERAPEASRVLPLCEEHPRLIRVLYEGRGTIANVDELFDLLQLTSTDFVSRNFEMIVILIWRSLAPKDGAEVTLELQNATVDYADHLAGHLGGNCARLRQTIAKHLDFAKHGPLMEISYEPEIHMWKAVSYKRSLLETTKATPQDLRRGSRIFGFFETERDAYQAYTLACQGKRPLPPPPSQEVEELVRVREAVRSRVQIILGLLSELHALSKVELEREQAKQLEKFLEEIEEHKKERAVAQELFEESLELEDIPASRQRFFALEKLQAKADRERQRSLIKSHRHQRCQVYYVLRNPDFIADLFYIGFSSAFHAQAKARAVDLLSYVLFDDPEKEVDEDDEDEDDEGEDGENQADEDDISEDSEELDSDSYSDDEDGELQKKRTGHELSTKLDPFLKPPEQPSIRKIWNNKMEDLLFGKPRMFFEVRFTAVLCTLLRTSAESDMRQIALEHLVRIASQPSTKQTIAKMEGIPILMTCLFEKDPSEEQQHNVTLAALTLRQLSVDPLNAQLMSMDGGFEALLGLQAHDSAGKLVGDIIRILTQHPYNVTNVYAHDLPRYTKRKSFAPAVSAIDLTKTGALRVQLDPLIFSQSTPSLLELPEDQILHDESAKREDADHKERELAEGASDSTSKSLQTSSTSSLPKPLKGRSFLFDKRARSRILEPMQRTNARLWMFPQTNGVLQELPVYQGPDGVRFHLFVDAEPPVVHHIPSARRPDPSDVIDSLQLESYRFDSQGGLETKTKSLESKFVPSLRIKPNPPNKTPPKLQCHPMLEPLTGVVLHDRLHLCIEGDACEVPNVNFDNDRKGNEFRLTHHALISTLPKRIDISPNEEWLQMLGIPGGKLSHIPNTVQEHVVAMAVSSTRLPIPRKLLTHDDSYLDILRHGQGIDWQVDVENGFDVEQRVKDLLLLLGECSKMEASRATSVKKKKPKSKVRSKRTQKLMDLLNQIDLPKLLPDTVNHMTEIIHAYQAARILLQAESYKLSDSNLIEIHQHIPALVLQHMRIRIQGEIDAMDPSFAKKSKRYSSY